MELACTYKPFPDPSEVHSPEVATARLEDTVEGKQLQAISESVGDNKRATVTPLDIDDKNWWDNRPSRENSPSLENQESQQGSNSNQSSNQKQTAIETGKKGKNNSNSGSNSKKGKGRGNKKGKKPEEVRALVPRSVSVKPDQGVEIFEPKKVMGFNNITGLSTWHVRLFFFLSSQVSIGSLTVCTQCPDLEVSFLVSVPEDRRGTPISTSHGVLVKEHAGPSEAQTQALPGTPYKHYEVHLNIPCGSVRFIYTNRRKPLTVSISTNLLEP